MLRFLQIRDYAIVDSLDLEIAGGFTCITGETGAGKSILVGALGLLSGQRADTSAVRHGADRAELSAEFVLRPDDPALDWLQDAVLDDGESCLVRRVIGANGRSRAWVNGTVVTLQQLSELGDLLVELHGQNEHIRLVRSTEQLQLLDGGGGHAREVHELAECYAAWRRLETERVKLAEEQPLDAGDRELVQYQLRELEQNLLPAQEFLDLESEHRMLAGGRDVVEALEAAAQALDAEPAGASRSLHRAAERLDRHAALDRDIAAAAGLLREAVINCDEALGSVQAALSRIDLSPERMEWLEQQLTAQFDLARKHHVEPERLPDVLERLKARLERAETLEDRLATIDKELKVALTAYRDAAAVAHARRSKTARQLSIRVTELMQDLGMKGGRFEIDVRLQPQKAPSARGDDLVELLVSANAGVEPGPLRKVASGGELSRISLAIKVAARAGAGAITQVFDEVDAGIGGETAHAVGALLKSLASGGQTLCVTHLAQVAVFADHQVRVLKTPDDQQPRVHTSLLQQDDRIDEIARMLGGRLSAQSRAHASELLAAASTQH